MALYTNGKRSEKKGHGSKKKDKSQSSSSTPVSWSLPLSLIKLLCSVRFTHPHFHSHSTRKPPHPPSSKPSKNLPCNAIIFDLGDVLFTWSASPSVSISPRQLKQILNSHIWFSYEKGLLGEEEAYNAVAKEFSLSADAVREALQRARDSLQSDPAMLQLIRELKNKYNVKVYAMSNVSAPDFEVLRTKVSQEEWDLFDGVFTSAQAGERKPNLGYYQYVLNAAGIDPERAVFIDDKDENVLSARSLGMKGVVFTTPREAARQLKNYVGDPVSRAERWTASHEGKLAPSVTDDGAELKENFSALLISELTGDRKLASLVQGDTKRLFNFWHGEVVGAIAEFPCDLDTTSIGLTVNTDIKKEVKNSIMDEMLSYRSPDGIIQTYFSSARPRIDPVVCINVLTLFYQNGRGGEIDETLNWVVSILRTRAYLGGTLYYTTADAFLFFFSRLLDASSALRSRYGDLFEARCRERVGAEGDALALSMRIVAAASAGYVDQPDVEALVAMQEEDGGFPIGWAYRFGTSKKLIGNRLLSTAFAIKALKLT